MLVRIGALVLCAHLGCGGRTQLELADESGAGGMAGGAAGGAGGAGAGVTASTSSTTSTGGCDGMMGEAGCAASNGCADGTREGFVDEEIFPDVAGCAGGFQVPGVLSGLAAACGQQAGDDSANPTGNGCSAEDLCAPGFHVCLSAVDLLASTSGGCAGVGSQAGLFFVSRQSGPGCGVCALGTSTADACSSCVCAGDCLQTDATANDVFGCGTVGDLTAACGPFDRFSNDVCSTLPAPWSCGGDGCNEAHALVKPGPEAGGALCCRAPLTGPACAPSACDAGQACVDFITDMSTGTQCVDVSGCGADCACAVEAECENPDAATCEQVPGGLHISNCFFPI